LPDRFVGAGNKQICQIGGKGFELKRDAFEIHGQFLLDNRTCTTIASAKRRTVLFVAMMLIVSMFLGDFGFMQRTALRLVDARDRKEYNNIKRQYVGKYFHIRPQI
jgi:hypothetical protein